MWVLAYLRGGFGSGLGRMRLVCIRVRGEVTTQVISLFIVFCGLYACLHLLVKFGHLLCIEIFSVQLIQYFMLNSFAIIYVCTFSCGCHVDERTFRPLQGDSRMGLDQCRISRILQLLSRSKSTSAANQNHSFICSYLYFISSRPFVFNNLLLNVHFCFVCLLNMYSSSLVSFFVY